MQERYLQFYTIKQSGAVIFIFDRWEQQYRTTISHHYHHQHCTVHKLLPIPRPFFHHHLSSPLPTRCSVRYSSWWQRLYYRSGLRVRTGCRCVSFFVSVYVYGWVCMCVYVNVCGWVSMYLWICMGLCCVCVRACLLSGSGMWQRYFPFFFFFYSVIVIWNSSGYSRIKAKYCHTRGTRGKSQISKPGSSEGPGHTEPNRLQITAGRIGGLR